MPRLSRIRASRALSRIVLQSVLALLLTPAQVHAADKPGDLAAKLARQKLEQGEVVKSIANYKLDGWSYIDSRHLVIHTGPSTHYLISLLRSCPDLSSTENIAFTSTVNQLTKFDKLIVRSAGGIRQQCPIEQIYTLKKIGEDH